MSFGEMGLPCIAFSSSSFSSYFYLISLRMNHTAMASRTTRKSTTFMPVTEAIREEKNDAILEGKINLNKNYIK